VTILRALLRGERLPDRTRHFALPDAPLAPAPGRASGLPLGSELGLPSGGATRGTARRRMAGLRLQHHA
jgi:hypothetical protein